MRDGKLTVFTLHDGTSITTRSALEARWAIFFSELKLAWKYEPCRIGNYLPDFKVFGLGFVEIKPRLDLLIKETSQRIERAARQTDEKIYAFVGETVSFNTVAMYHHDEIYAAPSQHMIRLFGEFTNTHGLTNSIWISACMARANRAKLDHFASIAKVLELETLPAQRKIVREASEKLKAEFNR